MKIIRAGLDDTDIFTKSQLIFGACCFYTEDKSCKYYFKIKGREATLYTNNSKYIDQAIDEFLFYSGFITTIMDENGKPLKHRAASDTYLHEISRIQPSQFYINKRKLENCRKWAKSIDDIIIPIVVKDGKTISLDGHTRLRAAIDLGYNFVYVYHDDFDEYIFGFVDEAVRRKIYTIADMEIVSDEDYALKWHKFCDEYFANL